MTTAPDRPRLDDDGTPEAVWAAGRLHELPELQLGRFSHAVLVAPHPDDEVLAAGGLMQRLCGRGTTMTVVSVTDGEASHPHSRTVTPPELADRRALERRQALTFLCLGTTLVVRLALPDGGVSGAADELEACLRGTLGRDALCVVPWEHDGHPDHDAAGQAAAAACAATGATLLSSLVWTWHWARPGDDHVPWERARRLDLSRMELLRKRWATRSFVSQTAPLSDAPGDESILPPAVLARFDRAYEVFLT